LRGIKNLYKKVPLLLKEGCPIGRGGFALGIEALLELFGDSCLRRN